MIFAEPTIFSLFQQVKSIGDKKKSGFPHLDCMLESFKFFLCDRIGTSGIASPFDTNKNMNKIEKRNN